jgi:TM2 domain-containing membrane protein YozV
MNCAYRIYFIFIALLFLFACNIEKRQYRSGYYISSPATVKNSAPAQKKPVLPTDAEIADAGGKYILSGEKSFPLYRSLPASNSSAKEPGRTPERVKNKPVEKEHFKQQNPGQHPIKPVSSDDEKIKKDVKDLLLSSAATFFLAVLYGIFSIAGLPGLTSIIFILTPFSIIGVWIFALLLYTKYSQDQSADGELKPNDRIITKKKAFLLAGFLGIFGAHRFYLGYTKMGILEMFTLGGFFILYFIDLIRIKTGKLKPQHGDYAPPGTLYTNTKKNKVLNKSQKQIKLALLISTVALLIILGFAIFF